MDQVTPENCGNVLDENGACAVDPMGRDENVDTAKAYYSFSM